MDKLVVCIMGQNCERFLPMCLESVKDADKIVYIDGGSIDQSKELALTFDTTNKESVTVLENEYNQEDKQMNGKQRNFYLNYVKEYYSDWWCLAIDVDEVVEDLFKIKNFIKTAPTGLYYVKMRHFIGDLGHEDATDNGQGHWVPNRLFYVDCADKYPEVEHPVLIGIPDNSSRRTDCTTIWHLAYIPNLWEIKKRYENHLKKSNMHTPQYLKQWYGEHLFGQYPKKGFNIIEIPPVILKHFGMDPDEIYFVFHRTLEVKHFIMLSQWINLWKKIRNTEHKPSILDIGCGVGLYGYAAETMGANWNGIELSDWAVKNKITKFPIKQGDITKLELKPDSEDIILGIDILEHLNYKDLDKSIENIKNAGDLFIFSIPFLGDPNLDADPTHKIKESKEWWIKQIEKGGLKQIPTPEDFLFHGQILLFSQ